MFSESSTENRNQSRDDYLLAKEDYSDYEDYYEYNEADYDDLDSDNIHQLQSEDGRFNNLISLICLPISIEYFIQMSNSLKTQNYKYKSVVINLLFQ